MPDRGIQEVAINKPKDIYGTGIENDMRAANYQVRLLPGPSFSKARSRKSGVYPAVLQSDLQSFRMVALFVC